MKKYSFMSLVAALLPLSLIAHPGHGETEGFTIIHYLIEPIHATAIVGGVLLAVIYLRWKRKKSTASS